MKRARGLPRFRIFRLSRCPPRWCQAGIGRQGAAGNAVRCLPPAFRPHRVSGQREGHQIHRQTAGTALHGGAKTLTPSQRAFWALQASGRLRTFYRQFLPGGDAGAGDPVMGITEAPTASSTRRSVRAYADLRPRRRDHLQPDRARRCC